MMVVGRTYRHRRKVHRPKKRAQRDRVRSRLRRRLSFTRLRLAPGPERPQHVAGAAPRSHQLGVVAEPIAHQPVEQSYLFDDLGGDRIEIGAGSHMIAPPRTGRFQRLLELRQGFGEMSVDRFHRSFDVRRQEEQAVDLVIVLDSLLGNKGPGAVHRLGIRLPLYISTEPDERLHLSQLVHKAYSMRSASVHGGRLSPLPQGDLAVFLAELEEAIRKAMRRAVLEAAAGTRRIADIPKFIDEDLILGIGGKG